MMSVEELVVYLVPSKNKVPSSAHRIILQIKEESFGEKWIAVLSEHETIADRLRGESVTDAFLVSVVSVLESKKEDFFSGTFRWNFAEARTVGLPLTKLTVSATRGFINAGDRSNWIIVAYGGEKCEREDLLIEKIPSSLVKGSGLEKGKEKQQSHRRGDGGGFTSKKPKFGTKPDLPLFVELSPLDIQMSLDKSWYSLQGSLTTKEIDTLSWKGRTTVAWRTNVIALAHYYEGEPDHEMWPVNEEEMTRLKHKKAVCRIYIDGRINGTGFSLNDTVLVTCFHVLFEKKNDMWSNIGNVVEVEFDGEKSTLNLESRIFPPALDLGLDVAVFPWTDAPATIPLPAKPFRFLDAIGVQREKRQRVWVCGFGKNPNPVFPSADQIILGFHLWQVCYSAPTQATWSGSPVFNKLGDLVAIHRAGGPLSNHGVTEASFNVGLRFDLFLYKVFGYDPGSGSTIPEESVTTAWKIINNMMEDSE